MKVLGVHDGHNASACLLDGGRLVACIQEERLAGQKNYWGLPVRSIQRILRDHRLAPADIDRVALASLHTPRPADVLERYKGLRLPLRSQAIEWLAATPVYSAYKRRVASLRTKELRSLGFPEDRITRVEHHTCHASAAYYGSPFRGERVLVLTSDGSGDGLCATVSVGEGGRLRRLAETKKGHSIGNVYAQVTFLLGLVPWEHEWKVMGMAPYAPAEGAERSYEVFRRYLELPDGALSLKRAIPEPTHLIYRRLRRELELHRFDWICAGVQRMTEDLLVRWVRTAMHKTGIRKLALAGGVFMNVKANKALMEIDSLEDMFVFPSCGDESNSIGAAYWTEAEACQAAGRPVDVAPLGDVYLGPSFSDADVEAALAGRSWPTEKCPDIDSRVAELLAGGEIVARCQGPMEFGARALGNRSILADPAHPGVVLTINQMVKKRDFWMPFAPVVSEERQHDYIRNPKGVRSPHMMLSFDSTDRRGEMMAAVHPADGTARAQILSASANPGYHRLLREFERRTGRGVLLNTSFNIHGRPIVCGPEEALWAFENSGLRALALGSYLVRKPS
jgi:carbamoyltransferase